MKVKAFIEKGDDGIYVIYTTPNSEVPYVINVDGKNVEATKLDFMATYQGMKELFPDSPDLEFEFVFDFPSFINYFDGIFTLSGLSIISGINQRQLSHYVNGTSSPRKGTIIKIRNGIKKLTSDLNEIDFLITPDK